MPSKKDATMERRVVDSFPPNCRRVVVVVMVVELLKSLEVTTYESTKMMMACRWKTRAIGMRVGRVKVRLLILGGSGVRRHQVARYE